jgi:MoxR-like ATPase
LVVDFDRCFLEEEVNLDFTLCSRIMENVSQVIVGKSEVLELVLVALLAEGHLLLEDVPGVGKTLIAKALAQSFGGLFKRVQFTPDLLPGDITGFNIYDQRSGQFHFHEGPVITNILLADEINRAIPRTQSSLLESMEERQVTIDGTTYPLPKPFLVLATQNPIELEGTFPLPEAQLDRFLLKIQVGYPQQEEEILILERFQEGDPLGDLKPLADPRQLAGMQQARRSVRVSRPIKSYITDIVGATRNSQALRFGASPRGSLGLMRAGQALAAIRGRAYVLPDDIKVLVQPVLAHRLILKEEERLRGGSPEHILDAIVKRVPVPAPTE